MTPPDLLASTLVDARVDLNPHQVEAALFAFRSPLSQGVILADKVGLGKTIEDGRPSTEFMKYGDTIRIEMKGRDGQNLFGAIDQDVVAAQDAA